MIRHIVMWKFREGEEENREKFLSGLQALDGVIPEIRHMEIHRSCKGWRTVLHLTMHWDLNFRAFREAGLLKPTSQWIVFRS